MSNSTTTTSWDMMGKPRTGLPDNISVGMIIGSVDDKRVADFNLRYALWEYQLRNGSLVAFWGSPTKQIWVWADCSQRWWTPDVQYFQTNTSVKQDTSGRIIDSGKTYSNPSTNNTVFGDNLNSNISTSTNANSGVTWLSWDGIKREWIRRESFCDNSAEDECKKYGINCPDPISSGKIYTRIDAADVLPGQIETITYGIWTNNVGSLTTFHQPTLSGSVVPYHRTVYNKRYGACDSEPQFDIAYGHDAGSGSIDQGGYDWMTPTNATYGQYRLLCLGANDRKFKIGSKNLSQIYIVNIRRSRFVERVDEGNIELNIAHLSGSKFTAGGRPQNAHTGSNVKPLGNGKTIRLIDDSRLNLEVLSAEALSGSYREHSDVKAQRVAHGGAVYYMVSGTIERGVHNQTNPHVYGMIYPKLGIMVLDGDRLDASASFMSVTGSQIAGDNAAKLFTAISGAAKYTDPSGDYMGFQARRKETQFCEFYFVRVKNADYNYTNNPTYQTGSEGQISDQFIETPKVYFSTVGLYNEQKECIAVGKVSRAIQKTDTSEALFKIRLKY